MSGNFAIEGGGGGGAPKRKCPLKFPFWFSAHLPKILLMSKMMTISLIVYCVCEEKVVNISYSHKHWRDIKQGAHNDQTFLHYVKGSTQSYTMLNGQTFLLLYLGHLIVNFPYSYFYFQPPSPAPAFILLTPIHLFWEYILPNINLVPF